MPAEVTLRCRLTPTRTGTIKNTTASAGEDEGTREPPVRRHGEREVAQRLGPRKTYARAGSRARRLTAASAAIANKQTNERTTHPKRPSADKRANKGCHSHATGCRSAIKRNESRDEVDGPRERYAG